MTSDIKTKTETTLGDVAKYAGVSKATASRVLNNSPTVTDINRNKVLEAIRTLNFKPNHVSRALALNRSFSVGILTRHLSGHYFYRFSEATEASLRNAGFQMLLTCGGGTYEGEMMALDYLLARDCDAIIAMVDHIPDEELLNVNNSGTPIVPLFNRNIASIENQCINIDFTYGFHLATKHLIELGHRDIALVIPSRHTEVHEMDHREKGYKQALAEANIPFNPELLIEAEFYRYQDCATATQKLLNKGIPFTAVIYFNDDYAFAGMKTLTDAGYSIPHDISVTGCDNTDLSQFTIPELTTVHQPIEQIAHSVSEIAIALANGNSVNTPTKLALELVVRKSTASAPR